ncbi:MAG: efflux RND transporter periplasmic adaptor subunit [Acetatifactor sp.]|nr:efflux RND transporter periplasmic adaptor subunit [Acetatifactor sp.]
MKNIFKKNSGGEEQTKPVRGGKGAKKKKSKKTLVIIIVVVIALLLLMLRGCGGGESGAMVTTTNAERGSLQESVSTSGTVSAEDVTVFFAPTNGKLANVNVAAGDTVKAGDVLIAYDSTRLDRDFREATLRQEKSNAGYNNAISDSADNQAKLNEATTNLAVLDQQLTDQKAYLKDLEAKLSESQRGTQNSLADENYDLTKDIAKLEEEMKDLTPGTDEYTKKEKKLKQKQSQLSRNNYLQQVANSSDYVAEMQAEIKRVQEQIADEEAYKAEMQSQKNASENGVMDSYDKISYEADKELAEIAYAEAEKAYYESKSGLCAEFDGVVTEVSAVQGSVVTEGMQLCKLESTENVKVSLQASKQDVAKLAIGQKAEVTISGNTYAGTVSKINRMASMNNSGTPMVGVEVHIDEPDEKIILGLDAKLTIETRSVEDALLVPVEAINADREGDFLYVVEDGKVVRKPVTCGISNDTYTEIIEGITEEDQVIVTYYGSLEEGMAVTVMPTM